MSMELDPRVQRFQAIKAQGKARALKRKEVMDQIRASNPGASDAVVEQIFEGHLKSQKFSTIEVCGPKGKKPHKVKVQKI